MISTPSSTDSQQKNGLTGRVKALFDNLKSIHGIFTLVLATIPTILTAAISQSAPPGTPAAAGLVAVFGIIGCLFVWFLVAGKATKKIYGLLGWSVILWLVFTIAYAYLWVFHTIDARGQRHIVVGQVTQEVIDAADRGLVDKDNPIDLLDKFGHQSDKRIWRWQWLNLFTGLLNVTFFAGSTFFLMSLFVGFMARVESAVEREDDVQTVDDESGDTEGELSKAAGKRFVDETSLDDEEETKGDEGKGAGNDHHPELDSSNANDRREEDDDLHLL